MPAEAFGCEGRLSERDEVLVQYVKMRNNVFGIF